MLIEEDLEGDLMGESQCWSAKYHKQDDSLVVGVCPSYYPLVI